MLPGLGTEDRWLVLDKDWFVFKYSPFKRLTLNIKNDV